MENMTMRQLMILGTFGIFCPPSVWGSPHDFLGIIRVIKNEIREIYISEVPLKGLTKQMYYYVQPKNMYPAFKTLLEEGLYFQVHKYAFLKPTYYCTYDTTFLEEINYQYIESVKECWKKEIKNLWIEDGDLWREKGACFFHGVKKLGPYRIYSSCHGTLCSDYVQGNINNRPQRGRY